MELIKGKLIAESILTEIKERVERQSQKPKLAVIMVGNDEASQIYVKLKEKASKDVGIDFQKIIFPAEVEEIKVIETIKKLNEDSGVNGIIVQLPLPPSLSKSKVIDAIAPDKDVDGFHRENRNAFLEGKEGILLPVFPVAIVKLIEEAIKNNKILNRPQKVVIVCHSPEFGEVMKKVVQTIGLEGEFVFCDELKKTSSNKYAQIILKRADVIVTACGVPKLIDKNLVKKNAIIIDGGITRENGKVIGDVNIGSIQETDCVVSPVPGGVGPVTVAMLLRNVYLASRNQTKK